MCVFVCLYVRVRVPVFERVCMCVYVCICGFYVSPHMCDCLHVFVCVSECEFERVCV